MRTRVRASANVFVCICPAQAVVTGHPMNMESVTNVYSAVAKGVVHLSRHMARGVGFKLYSAISNIIFHLGEKEWRDVSPAIVQVRISRFNIMAVLIL